MLTIKTSVKQSNTSGLGLFAEEFIPKGTVLWKFDSRFDLLFTPKEVEEMKQFDRDLIMHHAFLSKLSGKYVYPADNDRFMNHSLNSFNVSSVEIEGEPELCGVANKDIEIGEELLANYRAFDANDAVSDQEYLNF
jgi:hypothetical protein